MLPLFSLLTAIPFIRPAGSPEPAPELFSPVISDKILATFNASLPQPARYPQYTDRTDGVWLFFNPDTWTSGFLPATGYALNKRKLICGNSAGQLQNVDWLSLSRSASDALIPLEIKNGIGHDVGFLSIPFMEELAMFVLRKR